MAATDKAYKLARKLRKEMSLPEVLLWRLLRQRPHDLKFRRQHPRDAFPLDFYCPKARLIIEIDGASHEMGDRPQLDEARDAWMERNGLRTVRVAARDILESPEEAAASIVALCLERSRPLHQPSAGPPPRRSAAGRN
jgi:very-short-patch-repair endonuclease